MLYKVILTASACKDLVTLSKKAPLAVKKVGKLLDELKEHPRTGTGQVERLKHFSTEEIWSRRITKEHRLVYKISDDVVEVLVLSAFVHYEN